MEADPYCSVNPAADSIIPAAAALSSTEDNQFYIKIEVEIIHPPLIDEDEDVPDYLNLETCTHNTEAFFRRDLLTRNDTSWSVISEYLSGIGIPIQVQPSMIHRISSCAQEMASADQNVGRKVLPMSVFVSYVDYDQVSGSSGTGSGPSVESYKAVAASESAVAGLKNVILKEKELKNNCTICLERMEVGTEVKRMPCQHCFHGDCIVKWLGISNLCPLCRFQLPVD